MCITRENCGNLFDNHGDPRNITMQTIQDAANVAGITVPEALRNIQRGMSSGLRGMTDWTGAQESTGGQQDSGTLVMDDYAASPQLSSASPSPSPSEKSPGS